MTNLKIYDLINCLNKNLTTHFTCDLEKEKRYDIGTLSRPTLKSCSFPIHQPGEIKNSHEPPTGRNFFFQSLCLKRKTTQRFKKISSQYSKNFTLYISIFNFYVQFLYWFIIIWWCEKLLGINIDCKLSFDDHIGKICKNAGAKLNALTRVAQYINTEKST